MPEKLPVGGAAVRGGVGAHAEDPPDPVGGGAPGPATGFINQRKHQTGVSKILLVVYFEFIFCNNVLLKLDFFL